MTVAAAWLTLRLHRDVVAGALLAFAALAALALIAGERLASLASGTACPNGPVECASLLEAEQLAGMAAVALGSLPVVGLFLGAPILAQELERSTAGLAWSLDASRVRWFVHRAAPIAAIGLAIGVATAVLADRLESVAIPGVDPWASFHGYGLRGPLLPARLLLTFGCAVFIGGLLGRTLPALIVSFAIAAGILLAVDGIHKQVLAAEAQPVAQSSLDERYPGLQVAAVFRLPNGELATYEDLEARFPDPAAFDRAIAGAEPVVFTVAPERYPEAVLRESVVVVAAGLGFLAAAGCVLAIRTPNPGAIPVRLGRRVVPREPVRRLGVRVPDAGIRLAAHRMDFVAGASVALAAAVAIAVVVLGLWLGSPPAHCLADIAEIPDEPGCAGVAQFLLLSSDWGNRLFAAMAIVPWLVGSLVGVVVVGREIEGRTAVLAWSLAADRRRWLLPAAGMALALVVVLIGPSAVLSGELQRAGRPWVAPDATFDNYGLRGLPVFARAVAGLFIGLLAGAVTGRVLTALLWSIAGCVGLAAVLAASMPYGLPVNPGASQGFRGVPLAPGVLAQVEIREAVLLTALVAVLLLVTSWLVQRRRPD